MKRANVHSVPGRSPVTLGLDVGSTNLKAVALSPDGSVVARAQRPTPRDPADLTIDPADLFNALEDMALECCGPDFTIQAACAAGVGEDGILIDQQGQSLGRALAWFDPRRNELIRRLEPHLAAASGLGVPTDAARTLVGWLWAREQMDAARAASWIALADFASSRWAHQAFISDTLAARTAAWTVDSRSWLVDRVELTLGSTHLLPPVVSAGHIIGPARSPRLQGAGVLTENTLIVAGGHDHPIAGWGVGCLHPGAILDSMGTAEVVVAQSAEPCQARSADVDVSPGIRASGCTLLRVEELDRNIRWASQDPEVARALRQLIDGTREPDEFVASTCFLRGRSGGLPPSYAADAPAAPESRAAAVLGALARAGAEAVEAVSSRLHRRPVVYAAGGWTRSPGWISIKQSVTDIRLRVITEPEVTAVGAALLAASAIGWDTAVANAPI